MAELTEVDVLAGQTTSINIELDPVPASSQPPTLKPEQPPVVLVRGRGKDTDCRSKAAIGHHFAQPWLHKDSNRYGL